MGIVSSCWKSRLPSVDKVDVNKMLGSWKVIAVIPTPYEKDGHNSTERYSWDSAKKRIDVDFKLNKGSPDGKLVKIPQKIYTGGYPESTGRWKASPFWPVMLDYIIMDVAEDYSWVVVGHPSRNYWWLMAKEATSLPQEIIDAKLKFAEENGFPIKKIFYPKHTGEPEDMASSK